MPPKRRSPQTLRPAALLDPQAKAITTRSCPQCYGMLATSKDGKVWCTRIKCDYREDADGQGK